MCRMKESAVHFGRQRTEPGPLLGRVWNLVRRRAVQRATKHVDSIPNSISAAAPAATTPRRGHPQRHLLGIRQRNARVALLQPRAPPVCSFRMLRVHTHVPTGQAICQRHPWQSSCQCGEERFRGLTHTISSPHTSLRKVPDQFT